MRIPSIFYHPAIFRSGSPNPLPLGIELPGIIQSYVFVAAATGLPDDKVEGLKELQVRPGFSIGKSPGLLL